MHRRITLAILLGIGCLVGGLGRAQETKEEKKTDEKKVEPQKDVVINSELIAADLKDKVRPNCYCKTYTYKMVEGRTYQIDCTSVWDNYLRLEDATGQQVASDDDGGGGRNARITHQPSKSGEYTVIVTSFGDNVTGKFTLTIKQIGALDPKKVVGKPGEPIELKLVKGEAAIVTELTKDDTLFQNKIHKLFHFQAEEGTSYQIDHMSGAFDAYLYLEDANGNIVAQDDDGGNGLNSRITFKAAKAGKYRILTTSLSGKNTGAFTLRVQQTDPAPREQKDEKKADSDRQSAAPTLREVHVARAPRAR